MDMPTTTRHPLSIEAPFMEIGLYSIETELYHRRRYHFFRPWMQDRRVLDLGCGSGHGVEYASAIASEAVGVDRDPSAIAKSQARHPLARFRVGAGEDAGAEAFDVVFAFEVVSQCEDPDALIANVAKAREGWAVSVENVVAAGQGMDAARFRALIERHAGGRAVTFLSQEARFPGRIQPGLDESALHFVAAVGELDVPKWPLVGVALSTFDNAELAKVAMITSLGSYPGPMWFSLVANGCSDEGVAQLRELQRHYDHVASLYVEPINVGASAGFNRAFAELLEMGCPYVGAIGDDVIPSNDAWAEMVFALRSLEAEGYRPGMVAPVSNYVSGRQQIQFPAVKDYPEMIHASEVYHRLRANTVAQAVQIRPVACLSPAHALREVGGYDVCFGFGTCGDDDQNMRMRLAGYTLWIVQGSFCYHIGSVSYRRQGVNVKQDVADAVSTLCRKWGVSSWEEFWGLRQAPPGVELNIGFVTSAA
jgi:SAM-dependent methyltransferase